MTDETLESRLYPPPATKAKDQRSQPDSVRGHRDLRRPGVTLQLLWEEYRGEHIEGYGYRTTSPTTSRVPLPSLRRRSPL